MNGPQGLIASGISAGAGVGGQLLTAGTATYSAKAQGLRCWNKFSITNAMVTALAGVADDITICTLTAKTIVYNALMVITGAATNLTSLTGAVGRTGALYIDWLVAQSMKAAANTVYGDAAAELGTGLNVVYGDLASWTSTTAIKAHFISGVENLSTILTFGLDVYLETAILT